LKPYLIGPVLEDEIDRLEKQVKADHKAKVEAANKALVDDLRHIKWLRDRIDQQNGAVKPRKRRRIITGLFREPTPRTSDKPESLSAGIKLAVRELKQFTADDVGEWLKKHAPAVGSGDRRDAITVALSRLRGKGEVEVVTPGLRGQAQVYKFAGDKKETPE
jgi:hypothetical protein